MRLPYEITFTLRVLRKNIGFNTLCVLVIALGIAVSIPLYSLVRNITYASLPFPDSDRMILIKQLDSRTNSELPLYSFDDFQFNSIINGTSSYEVLGAFYDSHVTFSDGDYAESFYGVRITTDAMRLAPAVPVMGRTLLPSDQLPGAESVVVIGFSLWQSYYGGATDIIGRVSQIAGESATIVGVMPEGFRFPMYAELWQPLSISGIAAPSEGDGVAVIGLLSDGENRQIATTEVQTVMQRLAEDYPEDYSNTFVKVTPISHLSTQDAYPIGNTIAGLAIGVFFLVCLNVANLLLVRATERMEELAIRSSVGASRIGLISHVLIESFVICVIGTVLGLICAVLVIDTLTPLLMNLSEGGRRLPFWIDIRIDVEAVAVALALMLVLWLISGSLAAWRASGAGIGHTLASDKRGAASLRTGKLTHGMVLVQTVFSFFLLILAGTFVFVLQQRYETDAVENVENYLSAVVSLNIDTYEDPADRERFRSTFKDALVQGIDEVSAVSFSSSLPGNQGRRILATINGEIANQNRLQARQYGIWIDDTHLQNIGLDLIEGRYFDSADNSSSEPVVIVDENFVAQQQINGSPIGRQIEYSLDRGQTQASARIIGVVPHLGRTQANNGDNLASVYFASLQQSPNVSWLIIQLTDHRTTSFSEIEQRIKSTSAAIDRQISIDRIKSLKDESEISNSETSIFVSMFGGAMFGVLILVIVGVYGLISRSVNSRTSEVGIRRAMGSSDFGVINLFMKYGLTYLAIAMLIGGGGAILAVDLVDASTDFALNPSVAPVFIAVAIVISSLICFASYVPVRRVVAIEPGEALHYE